MLESDSQKKKKSQKKERKDREPIQSNPHTHTYKEQTWPVNMNRGVGRLGAGVGNARSPTRCSIVVVLHGLRKRPATTQQEQTYGESEGRTIYNRIEY